MMSFNARSARSGIANHEPIKLKSFSLYVFQNRLYLRIEDNWFFIDEDGLLSDAIHGYTLTKLDHCFDREQDMK